MNRIKSLFEDKVEKEIDELTKNKKFRYNISRGT